MYKSKPNTLISIIVATYNRSDVLRIALESIKRQSFSDFEVWVIGDACTDDSDKIVETLNDSRFNYYNLEKNIGEQSGPNNEGVRRANGEYIAFLNHDDLWWPDHLEALLSGIEESGADFVFSMVDSVKTEKGRWNIHRTIGARSDLLYDPRIHVPASCWLFRRELTEQVGLWRFYQDTYLWPSHDWLYRAWKKGITMRLVPWMTVAIFPSGKRKNSYVDCDESEQRMFVERMLNEKEFRAQELADIALGYRMHWLEFQAPEDLLRHVFTNVWQKLALKAGIHPITLSHAMRLNRKGERLDLLRKTRGLKQLR